MDRFLLLSKGLGAVPAFARQSPEPVTFGFVPTAGDPYDVADFVERDRSWLRNAGFVLREMDLATMEASDVRRELDEVDVIFVAGGNTFYLLQEMRRSGFAELIRPALERGLRYVGASAGAIVVGPTIEPIKGLDDSTAAPKLESFEGLGLLDFVVLPHAEGAATYASVIGAHPAIEFLELNDNQAVLVSSDGARRRAESVE